MGAHRSDAGRGLAACPVLSQERLRYWAEKDVPVRVYVTQMQLSSAGIRCVGGTNSVPGNRTFPWWCHRQPVRALALVG